MKVCITIILRNIPEYFAVDLSPNKWDVLCKSTKCITTTQYDTLERAEVWPKKDRLYQMFLLIKKLPKMREDNKTIAGFSPSVVFRVL